MGRKRKKRGTTFAVARLVEQDGERLLKLLRFGLKNTATAVDWLTNEMDEGNLQQGTYFICNLTAGMKPKMSMEKVKAIDEVRKEFSELGPEEEDEEEADDEEEELEDDKEEEEEEEEEEEDSSSDEPEAVGDRSPPSEEAWVG